MKFKNIKNLFIFKNIKNLFILPILYGFMDLLTWLISTSVAMLFVFGIISAILAVDAWLLINIWPEVIPVLFPAAVSQGFIASSVSFKTMFWVLAALYILKPINMVNFFKKQPELKEKEKCQKNK